MLKVFRKKIVAKFILWGLLILILPAFVMWGGASMSRSGEKGPNYVGIIGKSKISFNALSEAMTGVRTQVVLNYFNQPQILQTILNNKPLMAKLAWDRILILDEANKLKFKVTDKEVVDLIRGHPLFLRNGVFDEKFYHYVLRNNMGIEARSFEEIVRENLLIHKVGQYMARDIKVTDEEVAADFEKEFAKYKIAYVLIEPKDFLDTIKIDDAAVKEFYEEHKNELILKSELKDALPGRMATYEESKETIEKHLKETDAVKTLKERADEIYQKLSDSMQNKNMLFEEAASEAALTAKETDFFTVKDKLEEIGDVPIIISAASGLKEFELSKPVGITKGFIIFEVVHKKSANGETFKTEKEKLIKKVREKKANVLMEEWIRELEEKAKLAVNLEEIDKYYR